jgi:hypothetical protein
MSPIQRSRWTKGQVGHLSFPMSNGCHECEYGSSTAWSEMRNISESPRVIRVTANHQRIARRSALKMLRKRRFPEFEWSGC